MAKAIHLPGTKIWNVASKVSFSWFSQISGNLEERAHPIFLGVFLYPNPVYIPNGARVNNWEWVGSVRWQSSWLGGTGQWGTGLRYQLFWSFLRNLFDRSVQVCPLDSSAERESTANLYGPSCDLLTGDWSWKLGVLSLCNFLHSSGCIQSFLADMWRYLLLEWLFG